MSQRVALAAPKPGGWSEATITALHAEREHAALGAAFVVTSARQDEALLAIGVEPAKGRARSAALDESWEGARAVWADGRADVALVNPDRGEVVLRWLRGTTPGVGQPLRLYARDFLTPLIGLWERPELRARAARYLRGDNAPPLVRSSDASRYIGALRLRERQRAAVEAALSPTALVIGPPGTGKTYTVGATVAYLLQRFPTSRILLTGPTNVSVDTALVAADEALCRLGREDLRQTMKRIGSRFDAKKYLDRRHLLVDHVAHAASKIAALELEEPPKSDAKRYLVWKDEIDRARLDLGVEVAEVVLRARVVAVTAASAHHWHEELLFGERWNFVVCDEASQIMLPSALMLRTLGARGVYAGDPNQLAPVVQSNRDDVKRRLGRSAFDALGHAPRVQLNEQSRMCPVVCRAVADTFYGGDLHVCPKAMADAEWHRERSPVFIDGFPLPPFLFDERGGAHAWSEKYGGFIRFASAQLVDAMVSELLGSYTDPRDILVLTPFRAQRALLRAMLTRGSAKGVRVSTVHRSQGSESKIVLFDPVDAGGRFLNCDDGRRLLNVAVSRAQAHVFVPFGPTDLVNPWLAAMQRFAELEVRAAGAVQTPFKLRAKASG